MQCHNCEHELKEVPRRGICPYCGEQCFMRFSTYIIRHLVAELDALKNQEVDHE